jgi:hypothetical protein
VFLSRPSPCPTACTTNAIGNNTWFGSSQPENRLQPVLTCDPRHFGKVYQASASTPTALCSCCLRPLRRIGQAGPNIWPYIRNPGYFGSDLAIFKAFKVTESQRFEVRISATNWLNHPNSEFGQNGNGDNQLTFVGVSSVGPITGSTPQPEHFNYRRTLFQDGIPVDAVRRKVLLLSSL